MRRRFNLGVTSSCHGGVRPIKRLRHLHVQGRSSPRPRRFSCVLKSCLLNGDDCEVAKLHLGEGWWGQRDSRARDDGNHPRERASSLSARSPATACLYHVPANFEGSSNRDRLLIGTTAWSGGKHHSVARQFLQSMADTSRLQLSFVQQSDSLVARMTYGLATSSCYGSLSSFGQLDNYLETSSCTVGSRHVRHWRHCVLPPMTLDD